MHDRRGFLHSYAEHEFGIIGNSFTEFVEVRGELGGVAIPGVFQEPGGHMIDGILDPLVQQRTQVVNGLVTRPLPPFLCDRRLQVDDGRPDAHARQVPDLCALFIDTEWTELQELPFEDGPIFWKQDNI